MKSTTTGLLPALLIAGSLLLGGCGSSDGGDASVQLSSLTGIWMRQDSSDAGVKGKEYLDDGTGYLGNFTSGSFTRAALFSWSLSGNLTTEDRPDGLFHEEIISFDGSSMQQRRQEDGQTRTWKKQ